MEKQVYGYIYMITNKLNGKSYIGQVVASKGKDRLNEHYRQAHYGYYPVTKFRNALRKYKLEDFTVETLDMACDKVELSEKEIAYIAKYDTFKNGYNSSKGGDGGCSGYKHSEEAKRKISLNNSKRKLSQETIRKMSEVKKGKKNIAKSKKINMFHIDGKFLKTFDCISDCAKFIGNFKLESNIRRVLNGRQKIIKVFTFKEYEEGYEQVVDDDSIKGMIIDTIHSKYVPLKAVNNATGEEINFASSADAANLFKISPSCIRTGIKRSPNSYKGYTWTRMK